MEEVAALIGIDWAMEDHAVCLWQVGSNQVEQGSVEQKPEALHDWVNGLRKRFEGKKIAIAVEQSKGALIAALMRYEFLLLYPLNPKSVASYREALRTSGAKDDPSDAELILNFLRVHRDRLRVWVPEDEVSRRLAMLVEFRRKIVSDVVRNTHRLGSLLKGYYPQALEMFGDLNTTVACDFLSNWPSLSELKRVRRSQLRKFYSAHNSHSAEVFEKRIALVKNAQALTEDPAIVCASVVMVRMLSRQLEELLRNIDELDDEIKKVFQLHPDREIYESLPGAGPVLEPRLAAAMGTNREKYESALEMQQFVGTAPVTERSGKSFWVHRRLARPRFLMQTHVEFASQTVVHCRWSAAYYYQQRKNGKGHYAAIRALGYKWDRIIFRCWKDRVPYDEAKYLASLKRSNSPLIQLLSLPKSSWTHCGDFDLKRQILQQLSPRVDSKKKKK
jgi:transposase